jgi:hypothetical protein
MGDCEDDLSAVAEECPLLEDVTRKRLVKTQQDGKILSGFCGDLCELWRLAEELELLVVLSCVYNSKSSHQSKPHL